MTEKEYLDKLEETMGEFCILAKSKGFDKEYIIKPACIIAASEQMHENFGDTIKAMNKVIELCKEFDDGEKFLQAVLALAKID